VKISETTKNGMFFRIEINGGINIETRFIGG
jgi:hypothetical protein